MAPIPSAASTLAEASEWWLVFRCHVCEHVKWWPCRMAARDLGSDRTVGDIVARLLCHRCRARPDQVELVDHPQADAQGFVGGGRVQRVRLIG